MDTTDPSRKVNIYLLYSPLTGEPRYVGASIKSPDVRRDEHVRDAFGGYPPNVETAKWIWDLADKGYLPSVRVLETCAWEDRHAREHHWIGHYKNQGAHLTNMRPVAILGPGVVGRRNGWDKDLSRQAGYRQMWHIFRSLGMNLETAVIEAIAEKWHAISAHKGKSIRRFAIDNAPTQEVSA